MGGQMAGLMVGHLVDQKEDRWVGLMVGLMVGRLVDQKEDRWVGLMADLMKVRWESLFLILRCFH